MRVRRLRQRVYENVEPARPRPHALRTATIRLPVLSKEFHAKRQHAQTLAAALPAEPEPEEKVQVKSLRVKLHGEIQLQSKSHYIRLICIDAC